MELSRFLLFSLFNIKHNNREKDIISWLKLYSHLQSVLLVWILKQYFKVEITILTKYWKYCLTSYHMLFFRFSLISVSHSESWQSSTLHLWLCLTELWGKLYWVESDEVTWEQIPVRLLHLGDNDWIYMQTKDLLAQWCSVLVWVWIRRVQQLSQHHYTEYDFIIFCFSLTSYFKPAIVCWGVQHTDMLRVLPNTLLHDLSSNELFSLNKHS